MSEKRAALYMTGTEEMLRSLNVVARYIYEITPKDPLYPPPLRPSRQEDIASGGYNEGEVAECCARLLAEHIRQGKAGDLFPLVEYSEGMSKLTMMRIKSNPLDSHIEDLHTISAHLATLVEEGRTWKGGVKNLKTPQDVAVLYAVDYIRKKRK